MVKLLLTFLVVLCACRKHDAQENPNPSEQLREKMKLYISLYKGDSFGWPTNKCDGLLFASVGALGGLPIDVLRAEKSPGEWQRHPAFDCYQTDASSTISKDMFVGLMLYLFKTKNTDALKRINTYGETHNWIMGEGDIGKTYMTPSMVYLLKDMISLGLRTNDEDDAIGVNTGFRAHLDILGILTRGEVYGKITDGELQTLKAQAERQPQNALFQAAYHKFLDGDQSIATELLLGGDRFPSERLPGSVDRCEGYLWQRDIEGSDWTPCPDEQKVHDGIDLIYAASLIL